MTVERMLVKMTHAIYYLQTNYAISDAWQGRQWIDEGAHAAERLLYRTWTHKAGSHGCRHCPVGSRGRKWAEGRGR